VGWENETLRFPTNLDRDAIVARLARVRELAETKGHTELAQLLSGAESMPAAQIGVTIIGAIGLVSGKPEFKSLSDRLEMLAVNLKNLR